MDVGDYWRIGYLGLLGLDEELMILHDFAHLIRSEAAELQQRAHGKIWSAVKDEEDRDFAHVQQKHLDKGVTTRFLAASVLLAGWAAYESAIVEYARHLKSPLPG